MDPTSLLFALLGASGIVSVLTLALFAVNRRDDVAQAAPTGRPAALVALDDEPVPAPRPKRGPAASTPAQRSLQLTAERR